MPVIMIMMRCRVFIRKIWVEVLVSDNDVHAAMIVMLSALVVIRMLVLKKIRR